MKTFKQWMEGTPINWKPSLPMAADPLQSAILKISRQKEKLPFSGNFGDSHVIQVTFGLTDQELAVLKFNKMLIKSEYGVNIDQGKFNDKSS